MSLEARLAQRPDDPVLIVSERAQAAAATVLPGYVVIEPPKGNGSSLTPLYGRKVFFWPDATNEDRLAAQSMGEYLLPHCKRVCLIDTLEAPRSTWNLADAVNEGWDESRVKEWVRGKVHDIPVPAAKLPVTNEDPPPSPDLIQFTEGLIPGSDLAYGRRLYARSGKNLHYTMERGWLVWSGQRWQVDDKAVGVAKLAMDSAESLFDEIKDSASQKEAFKLARMACQKRTIEATMWLTRAEPGIYQQLTTFDVNPMILNVRNGIVDLTTGELRPHTREARCTMIAGTHYDKKAEAPRWRQFIHEICLGNAELMEYLQRVCGYLLTASVREHCLFFMHGAGRNGKSVMVDALMKVMGDYAGAAEPEMLMTKKHQSIPVDVAALRGRRAVFLNETGQGQRFDEPKLKNLTGGDRLQARFMRENLFEFDPTHKLVLRGNHKPTVNGTDEGIWSRLRLVPFDMRLEPHELDKKLADVLHLELPGILTWAIQGCISWQREGLITPAIISQAVDEYRGESDVVGRFIEECCEVNVNRRVKAGSLYQRYKEFCELGGERWLSSKDFPTELEHRGYKRAKSNGQKFIEGLELVITAQTSYASREQY